MRKTLGFFSKCLAAAMPAMQDQLTAVGVWLAGSAGYVRLNHHKSAASFRMTLSFSEGHRPAQPAFGGGPRLAHGAAAPRKPRAQLRVNP